MAIWLDLEGLEQYLGIPKSTLYRLAQQDRIPGHKIGRAWRFDRDEVDKWIKSGGGKPGTVAEEVSNRDRTRKPGTAS